MTDPDLEFRAYLATGSATALARVFERVAPELLLLAHQFVRDAATAEDLVQATFLTAIESAARFDPDRRVVPWLAGILANHARMERRRRARRLDPGRLPSERPVDAAKEAERKEAVVVFSRALAGLPAQYREVLRLGLQHEVAPREIAATLGRTPDTVKTQLRRGRQLLERALPAGMASLAVLVLVRGRGIAAVRARVLAGAAGATKAIGVKVASVLLLVLLVAVGAWWINPDRGDVPLRSGGLAAESPRSGAAVPQTAGRRQAGRERADALVVTCQYAGETIPCSGIHVTLRPVGSDAWFRERYGISGPKGQVTFPGLSRGRFVIKGARGGEGGFEGTPEGPRTARLVIPPGVEIEGRVVDAHGEPAGRATIRVAARVGALDDSKPVCRTEPDGSFGLRNVARGRVLFATFEDRIPPAGRIVVEPVGTRAFLRMQLRGRGGTLRGTVTGPDGLPAANARVLVGYGAFYLTVANTIDPPLIARTDTHGSFSVEGIRPGRVPVWIRGSGTAIAKRMFDIGRGKVTPADIRLERAAVVRGIVRGRDGGPAGGARIRAWRQEPDMPPRYSRRAPSWGANRIAAFPDGRFALTGLGPGAIEIRVQHATHGRAAAQLAIAAGDQREWNPVLDPGLRIRGRLRDSNGQPLEGWLVRTHVEGRDDLTQQWAIGPDGTFDFGPCEDVGYVVQALDPKSIITRPRVRRLDVRPGGEWLDLVIPPSEIASSFFEGSLRGPEGRALASFTIELVDPLASKAKVAGSDGRFRIGPVPPLRYQVIAHAPGLGARRLGAFRPAPSAVVDIGEHRFEGPGTLALRCGDARGRTAGLRVVPISPTDGPPALSLHLTDGKGRMLMQPGDYEAAVWTNRIAMSRVSFSIRSGQTTEATLTLQRGYPRQVIWPTFETPVALVVEWTHERLGLRFRQRLVCGNASPVSRNRRFEPGGWTLAITTEDGRVRHTRFEIERKRDPEQQIIIPLPTSK